MAQQFDELYKSMNEELIEKRTLVVNPGAQINIQLNQDLDFSKVYQKEWIAKFHSFLVQNNI
mgnify:CR=1 FL=1